MYSKAKKTVALILAAITIFGIFSVGVFAAEDCKHNYTTQIVEVSCTEDGGTKYHCVLCGDEYLENVQKALGHVDENNDNACDRCGVSMGQGKLERLFRFLIDFIRWILGIKDK